MVKNIFSFVVDVGEIDAHIYNIIQVLWLYEIISGQQYCNDTIN